jgi:hypothetical protein
LADCEWLDYTSFTVCITENLLKMRGAFSSLQKEEMALVFLKANPFEQL